MPTNMSTTAENFAPLEQAFYDREPSLVARELLGKRLVRVAPEGRTSGRIVETEAYLSRRDPACHATRGQTRKNASMFGPPGRAYVYMIHSRWCLNAVTEPENSPSAVLIRAIEPLEGAALMQQRRELRFLLAAADGRQRERPFFPPRDLARGPGRLCDALAIDKSFDGWDLTTGLHLWVENDPEFEASRQKIARSPRIGISLAKERLLRFFLAENHYVSGSRARGRK
jgi:DNA-3-methyladenine glycosylase